jgi:hypothetical protein
MMLMEEMTMVLMTMEETTMVLMAIEEEMMMLLLEEELLCWKWTVAMLLERTQYSSKLVEGEGPN